MPASITEQVFHNRYRVRFITPSDWAQKNLFYVEVCGHFNCDGDYNIEREAGTMDNCLLLLTEAGSGTIETPYGTAVCHPQEIALIDCSQKHRYYANKEWTFRWFHLNGCCSQDLMQRIFAKQGIVIPLTDPQQALLFKKIEQESEKGTLDSEILRSSYIGSLLAELIAGNTQKPALKQRELLLQRLSEYFDAHYTEKIRIDALAAEMNISVSTLSHTFKEETGFSPYDYILHRRLEQAKMLLWTSDLTVGEIAYSIGFQSPAHFIKLFKKQNQITPSAFRGQKH